ncbi:MAG: ribosome biogenesis GTPase Der [Candidatus Methylomirabilis sp.]
MTPLPVVAIIGRPNVGKSTLFNRLVGGRKAIVHDEPGVTRDRLYATARWGGRAFLLGDTGGFELDARKGLAALVAAQVERAVQEAALILFVVDAREGVSPLDVEIARLLRKETRARIIVVPNKVDRPGQEALTSEFFRLGFDDVFPVSAEHGQGVAELADLIVGALPSAAAESEATGIRVAVVGRPNVGKSSLVNRILGQDRVIVSEAPGTTRDAIDTPFKYQEQTYVLIDTAGIRSRGKVRGPLERFSVLRALRAMERGDVALIVLDGPDGVTDRDAKIGAYAQEVGCGASVVVNKWDLMPPGADAKHQCRLQVSDRLRHLDYAPIAFVSALTGSAIVSLFSMLQSVAAERARRIPTHEINTLIGEAVRKHPPPSGGKRPIRFHYATQAAAPPPTFLLFVSDPRGVPVMYRRYLVNQIREVFGFAGVPIRLVFKGKRA